ALFLLNRKRDGKGDSAVSLGGLAPGRLRQQPLGKTGLRMIGAERRAELLGRRRERIRGFGRRAHGEEGAPLGQICETQVGRTRIRCHDAAIQANRPLGIGPGVGGTAEASSISARRTRMRGSTSGRTLSLSAIAAALFISAIARSLSPCAAARSPRSAAIVPKQAHS